MERRQFMAGAASIGISGIWASRLTAAPSRMAWREDRRLFPRVWRRATRTTIASSCGLGGRSTWATVMN